MQDHRSYKPCSLPIFKGLSKSSERKPNDLGMLQAEFTFQPLQICDGDVVQPDRRHFADLVHTSTIQNALQPLGHPANTVLHNDIHRESVFPDSVNAPESVRISPLSAVESRQPANTTGSPDLPVVAPKFKSLDWILDPNKGRTLGDRVLARLIQAEAHETDVWLRQDYRQAWICLSLAMKGSPIPFIEASQAIYGKHPDKVWPAIMHNRRMRLAKEFTDWWDAEGNRKPDIPKKPSVRNERSEQFVNERLAALVPKNKETA